MFLREPVCEGTQVERILRIVDYREEIVDLFKGLTDRVGKLGIVLATKATPREIQQAILKAKKNMSEGVVDEAVTCFEEAKQMGVVFY